MRECFYRRSAARGLDAPARRAFKAAEHLADMRRLHREIEADVVHYQWLTMPALDAHLLPSRRPRLMTAHYVLPPRPSRRQVASARKVFGRMDAVVAHSEHGAARLRDGVGLDRHRVRVIPHGAFDYLTRLPDEKPLPAELRGRGGPGDPLLRPAAPLQGARHLVAGLPPGERRRALDRRQPAHGRRAAARASPTRRRAASASSPASSRTPRSRRSSAVPTSSSCPTATPSTPASSTPPSPSASRWCSAPSAGSPRLPRQVPPASCRPEDPAELARALGELVADSGARGLLARAASDAASRPLLLGCDRDARPSPSTKSCWKQIIV